MTETTPGAATMTLTEFLKWQERHSTRKYDHITVTLTADELKDVAWRHSDEYVEQRDEAVSDVLYRNHLYEGSPAKHTSTLELRDDVLAAVDYMENTTKLTDEEANHIAWLTVYELSRLQLETFTWWEVNGEGQSVLVLWDLEEHEVRIESYEDYRIVKYYIDAYIAFAKQNGELNHPSRRKNKEYNHLTYRRSDIPATIRKDFRHQVLNETEKIIYSATPGDLELPFTAADVQQQDATHVMNRLLHLLGHVSEENGFWYGVKTTDYQNGEFVKLEQPILSVSADCSDFFMSASADFEEITEENFAVYAATFRQIEQNSPEDWTSEDVALIARKVFAVQVRQQEPPKSRIKALPQGIQQLFQLSARKSPESSSQSKNLEQEPGF